MPFIRAVECYPDVKVSQILTWVKSQFTLGFNDYNNQAEQCLYGWRQGAGHYFIDSYAQSTVFEDAPNFGRMNKQALQDLAKELYQAQFHGTDVPHCDKPAKSDLHPTMKPVKLMARLIANSTDPQNDSGIVLDPFGGSGSTLIACEQLGRACRMMELDPHYCGVIINRWEKCTGQTAEKI